MDFLKQTTEDYLKTIYLLNYGNNGVRAVEISERLKVSRPTVTVIVRRLIEEGYAIKNSEHKIFLTEKGEKLAEAVERLKQDGIRLKSEIAGLKSQILKHFHVYH